MGAFRFNTLEGFMNANGYIINGDWYPRVTSIIGIKAKPALMYFYAQAENYSSALAITSKSATEGTKIHTAVEQILKGQTPEVDENAKPAIDAFRDFLQFHSLSVDPLGIEKRIWSPKHKFAGTIDVLGEVNGIYGILDVKTSSGIFRDYNLQTAAYMGALEEEDSWETLPKRDIQTRWILRLDQQQICLECGAKKRTKGGREKIKSQSQTCEHKWSEVRGEWELKQLDGFQNDYEAFLAAKRLWEWENEYWLKQVGY